MSRIVGRSSFDICAHYRWLHPPVRRHSDQPPAGLAPASSPPAPGPARSDSSSPPSVIAQFVVQSSENRRAVASWSPACAGHAAQFGGLPFQPRINCDGHAHREYGEKSVPEARLPTRTPGSCRAGARCAAQSAALRAIQLSILGFQQARHHARNARGSGTESIEEKVSGSSMESRRTRPCEKSATIG